MAWEIRHFAWVLRKMRDLRNKHIESGRFLYISYNKATVNNINYVTDKNPVHEIILTTRNIMRSARKGSPVWLHFSSMSFIVFVFWFRFNR
jgi:hypothetical protein